MQLADPNLHLRLIEMCDCYLETDYMSQLRQLTATPSKNLEEDGLKYLALALLCALTEKAEKLSFKRKKGKEETKVTIKSDEQKIPLAAPSVELFDTIHRIVRAILHTDQDKDSMPLSLGIRSGEIEVKVKLERKPDKDSFKFKLPQSAA